MVAITVENYLNARVHAITVGNRKLFWVKMHDVQDDLGLKNISDLVSKKVQGIYETKYPTEKQNKKYKKSEAKIDKKITALD